MALPTGPAVTFLFTDIEGSTRLEQSVGTAAWSAIVGRHDELLRGAIEGGGGVVVKTEGDAFFAAFADPRAGVDAAVRAQRAIADADWPATCQVRVRMGAHLGEGRLRARTRDEPEDYVGIDVNYAARIAAAGNGGQIVVSQALVDALDANGLELADEGLRAVKDFEDPKRLHRVVVGGAADDRRPLRTLEPPSNLPGEVTELVGREAEIDAVARLLEASRIVTLTGPGGSGKTRVALGVAAEVHGRFPHGTWFVDLAALRDAGLLEPAIAAALGLRESPTQSISDVVRQHLRSRTALLVLDNLEQLLPDVATLVAELARAAPELRLLITSRELLRISGERGHPVPPLETDAGVRLFEARALAHRPDLVLGEVDRIAIRRICERVQGLPLAIELAAARVRLLSPALILDRLASSLDLAGGSRDLPERQRTLRGAIAWSHDLLTDGEKRLFRRLAVFAGGWTAEVAEQVVAADGDLEVDVLDGLGSLADKSLVRVEAADTEAGEFAAPRFDLHPLLREYAVERLGEAGERAVLEARHAVATAELVETLGARIQSPAGTAAVRRLDREQHNARAALEWARTSGTTELGLGMMGAGWRWFQQRGRIREARAILADLLARPADPTDPRPRIAALAAEGGLAYWASDFTTALAVYEERLALAEATGDALLRADAHYDIGFVFMVQGDPAGHLAHERLALDLYSEIGRQDAVLRARQALVLGVFQAGEYRRALELESQNLVEFRAIGSNYQIADSSTLHSAVYFRLGDVAAAWAWMQEGLHLFAQADNPSGIVRGLGMAAIVLLTYGDREFGARIAGATYQLMEEKGLMLAPVKVLHLPDPADLAVDQLGEVRARELLEVGATTPLDQVIAEVLAAPAPISSGSGAATAPG